VIWENQITRTKKQKTRNKKQEPKIKANQKERRIEKEMTKNIP